MACALPTQTLSDLWSLTTKLPGNYSPCTCTDASLFVARIIHLYCANQQPPLDADSGSGALAGPPAPAPVAAGPDLVAQLSPANTGAQQAIHSWLLIYLYDFEDTSGRQTSNLFAVSVLRA